MTSVGRPTELITTAITSSAITAITIASASEPPEKITAAVVGGPPHFLLWGFGLHCAIIDAGRLFRALVNEISLVIELVLGHWLGLFTTHYAISYSSYFRCKQVQSSSRVRSKSISLSYAVLPNGVVKTAGVKCHDLQVAMTAQLLSYYALVVHTKLSPAACT